MHFLSTSEQLRATFCLFSPFSLLLLNLNLSLSLFVSWCISTFSLSSAFNLCLESQCGSIPEQRHEKRSWYGWLEPEMLFVCLNRSFTNANTLNKTSKNVQVYVAHIETSTWQSQPQKNHTNTNHSWTIRWILHTKLVRVFSKLQAPMRLAGTSRSQGTLSQMLPSR